MTVVAIRNQNTPLNQTFTDDQVKLIKSTIAKNATDDELQLFLYQAQKTGLDPLAKQIHFVKRAGQMTIQTAIDGFRAIAARTGQHAGTSDGIFDGVAKDKDSYGNEFERPEKASVIVKKIVQGLVTEFSATARWGEYFPGAKQGFMWTKMPYTMLEKCAEAKALRKAFPEDLSGVYTDDEMQQADKKDIKSVPKPPPAQIPESSETVADKHHGEDVNEVILNGTADIVDVPEEEVITEDLTPEEIIAQIRSDLQMIIRDNGGNVVYDAECLKRFRTYCEEQGFKLNRKHWMDRLGDSYSELTVAVNEIYHAFPESVLPPKDASNS